MTRTVRRLHISQREPTREQGVPSGATVESDSFVIDETSVAEPEKISPEYRKVLETEIRKKIYEEVAQKAKKEIREEIEASLLSYQKELKEDSEAIDKTKNALEAAIRDIHDYRASLINEAESAAVKIAISALYKIVGEDGFYEKMLRQSVKNAMTSIRKESKMLIDISPQDFALIAPHLDSQEADFFNSNEKLAPGEVQLHSGMTTYNIGLIRQLDELRDVLLKQLKGKKSVQ